MKFSLLSQSGSLPSPSSAVNDLSLPSIFSSITGTGRNCDYFMSVISRPLCDIPDIRYRREIIADLEKNPGLTERLKTVFNRYDAMKSDWLELRSGVAATSGGADAELDAAWSSLKVTALFPNTLLSFFKNIRTAFDRTDLSSRAFIGIADYCDEMIENRVLAEIVDISESFRYNNAEDYRFNIDVTLNESLEVTACSLVERCEKLVQKKNLKNLFKGKKESLLPFEGGEGAEDARRLVASALTDVDHALSSLTNSLYETFYGISKELAFYETALEYIEYLRSANLGCVYAELSEPEEMSVNITDLRDLYLASCGMKADKIVPADIRLTANDNGMLIRGENGAGKTTFLRSFGVAQILTQAGLPIPASKAALSLRSDIHTHFSAAEEKFTKGDTAGRFESEARAVSQIISNLKPHSLILFNETFQTTAFAEGTRAMSDILSILPRLAVQYIFVTHLTGLFDRFEKTVIKCEFDEKQHKYRILG